MRIILLVPEVVDVKFSIQRKMLEIGGDIYHGNIQGANLRDGICPSSLVAATSFEFPRLFVSWFYLLYWKTRDRVSQR